MKRALDWFGGRFPRQDVAIRYDEEVSPLLISNAKEVAYCYLSLRILGELFEKGGTGADARELLPRIEAALPMTMRSRLEDELEHIREWIERVELPFEESNADLRFIREQDKADFRTIVREAIEQEMDLRCEYYRQRDKSWCLDRGTPFDKNEAFFVLESHSGLSFEIYFQDIRWIMLTGKTKSSGRARVLSFPTHFRVLEGEE